MFGCLTYVSRASFTAQGYGCTSACSAFLDTMDFVGDLQDDIYMFENLTDAEYGQLEDGLGISE